MDSLLQKTPGFLLLFNSLGETDENKKNRL